MRGGREEESVHALGSAGATAHAGAPPLAPGRGAPRVAQHRAGPQGQRVKMHVDSSQVAGCLNPVRGVRDAQTRAGIRPTDHARQNLIAEEEEDVAPRHTPGRAPRAPLAARTPSGGPQALPPGGMQRQRSGSSGGGGAAGGGGGARNFLEENRAAAAAAHRPAKAETRPDAAPYKSKREYGQVPTYLVERKLAMAEERAALEAAREAARVPAGMRLMPEGERLETLALLERNRSEVEGALSALPIIVETTGQRRRKDELERRLAEIEEAARVFGRKQVLVRL
ncbi:MAG: calmodulin-binding-domain-containing protein [Monoraphidium minutum]|nr:MAG: calmodulin-binding-domain-containing protein [Monoraphidium minutum]